MSSGEKQIIKTSCPRDCYDCCGIAVTVRDGEISLVTGNPEHPSTQGPLCGKCSAAYNGVWRDENARLLHPMRRTGSKGAGVFEPISWDEALTEVAKHLQDIIDADGPERIHHTHYTGTCSAIAGEFPGRFFAHIGATEIDPDTVCNKAGHVAWGYVFGDSLNGFDPRTAAESNCIVVWGANPSACAPHVDKLWLRKSNAKVIAIDPIRHDTAANADIHVQLKPGSDAALAFAIVHVMQRDGLLDQDFIAANVIGYEEIADEIKRCSPEWAAERTGVPAAQIEEVAQVYAAGPSILWLGQGLQRQPMGGNIFRACAMLPAFSGNIGKPGTGAYYLNDTFAIGERRGKAAEHENGGEDGPATVSQMDLPQLLQDTETIKAYMVWNCNPVASNPAQALMRKGLERDDLFTVVIDCFQTDTADYADIILPAASFLEFDDLCANYFNLMLGPQVKCAEPMGESLPNQEIFRRLAKAMNLDAEELYEDDPTMINELLEATVEGVSWDDLKAKGYAYVSETPFDLWENGKFSTPSGKIEIASESAKADGLPLTPQPIVDAEPNGEALRLLSPADKHLMNSSYGNDERVRDMMGPVQVTIHPADAEVRDIADGDSVTLSNSGGSLTFQAHVSDATPVGTLLTTKSRWPRYEPGKANVNLLHVPQKTDMGESTSIHGTEVLLAKA